LPISITGSKWRTGRQPNKHSVPREGFALNVRAALSETGYRSHFARMKDVEASSSPQDYARNVALGMLRSRGKTAVKESDQLPLF
jgi:hypothetical protein